MLEDAGIEFGPCRLEAYVHSPAHETNSLQQRLISAVAVAHSLKKTLKFPCENTKHGFCTRIKFTFCLNNAHCHSCT